MRPHLMAFGTRAFSSRGAPFTLEEISKRFYDKTIIDYGRREPETMSVKTMADFWTSRKSLDDKLIESANYLLTELPVRLAHRVVDMQSLPLALASNPNLMEVYDIYLTSFDQLKAMRRPVLTIEDNVEFSTTLKSLFDSHSGVVPCLAKSLRECQEHSSLEHQMVLQRFLDRMLVRRISTRMIAGQHLASMNMHPRHADNKTKGDEIMSMSLSKCDYIGLIQKQCKPAEVVTRCATAAQELCQQYYGVYPEIVIEGHKDISFAYARVHLEYILFEIIKNSMRATVEEAIKNGEKVTRKDLPTVVAVVSGSSEEICVKISDKGGGMPKSELDSIWDYGYSTAEPAHTGSTLDKEAGTSGAKKDVNKLTPMHGFGFGLPLSRVYAQYFGGDLQVNSMLGYGTDVYLKLNRLGKHMENIRI